MRLAVPGFIFGRTVFDGGDPPETCQVCPSHTRLAVPGCMFGRTLFDGADSPETCQVCPPPRAAFGPMRYNIAISLPLEGHDAFERVLN